MNTVQAGDLRDVVSSTRECAERLLCHARRLRVEDDPASLAAAPLDELTDVLGAAAQLLKFSERLAEEIHCCAEPPKT